MNKLSYTVKTPTFEGPLDLLLDLVTKRKLFINDVSLAAVTDDFMAYLEGPALRQAEYEARHMGEMAEFILIASTLMLIKSRSLLPMIELTQEEEESIIDLENRLALYAKFKELSGKLRAIYGQKMIFEKQPSKNERIVFSPDSKTDTSNLLTALNDLIQALPKKEVLPQAVVRKVVTLEETIEKLASRISGASRMSFRDFYGTELGAKGKLTYEKKVSIIVGFLAMLELVKRGLIRVSQEAGGDIDMEREEAMANK